MNQFTDEQIIEAIALSQITDDGAGNSPITEQIRILRRKSFHYEYVKYELELTGNVFGQISVDHRYLDSNYNAVDWMLGTDKRLNFKISGQMDRYAINEPMVPITLEEAWCRHSSGKRVSARVAKLCFRTAFHNNCLLTVDKEQVLSRFQGRQRSLRNRASGISKDETLKRIRSSYKSSDHRLRYETESGGTYSAFGIEAEIVRATVSGRKIEGFLFDSDDEPVFYSLRVARGLPETELEKYLPATLLQMLLGTLVLGVIVVAILTVISALSGPTLNERPIESQHSTAPIETTIIESHEQVDAQHAREAIDAGPDDLIAPSQSDQKPDLIPTRPIPAVSEVSVPAQLLSSSAPRYPRLALRRGIEGHVTVRFDIDLAGRVVNIAFLESSPVGVFDAAVTRALEGYRYQPRTLNETPVFQRSDELTFDFTLDN